MSAAEKETQNKGEAYSFGADVSRLLDIVANALYTNHDVFLRELISNAADACDRLRYDAIQKPELTAENPNFRIHVYKDTDKRTLTVVDNGVGMTKKELADHLGTIAKSGTAALMEQVKQSKSAEPLKLIGQFGVGFYASYMVANHVTVISQRAGTKEPWVWESDGRTGFNLRKPEKSELNYLDGKRGTAIILDLKDEASEFLIDEKIKQTVTTYSDHIDVKIFNSTPEETDKGEGQPINTATAIWMRPKSEITEEQYTEFYKHVTFGFDEPLMTSHWRAEGKIEYNALLFIPTLRPWDLYDPSRRHTVKLYVKRVFITDDLKELMYPWLRFVRGVIDSEDLPLNISRESLQFNPVLAKIRSSVTKRILSDLDKFSKNDPPGFAAFWGQFGPALKEGLYDAAEHREDIFKICRFYSSNENGDKLTSLEDYIERMKPAQKEIFYLSGESIDSIKNSPQLEGFKSRGIEVLFFNDTIDDFWIQQVHDYKNHPFKSITKGDISFDDLEEEDKEKQDESKPREKETDLSETIKKMEELLKDDVEEIRISKRLTQSPVCLVASDSGVDMKMEKVLKIHQKYAGESKPVMEINAGHPLIKSLSELEDNNPAFEDITLLLFDQARIIQGQNVKNPAEFTRRLNEYLKKGL